jgi:zinc/manganese transport system ATP-binding protein
VAEPALQLRAGALSFGSRSLWRDLDLDVQPGEFVAVLGANGTGKTTLLRAILGLQPLSAGSIRIAGNPARRGSPLVGYVPQEQSITPQTPLRSRDLVGFGVDGARWGIGRLPRTTPPMPRTGWPNRRGGVALKGRSAKRRAVDAALRSVGAGHLAERPVQQLSGGEQQRVRIAQALVTDPAVLLCDEPLLSLDLNHQRAVVSLIDARRRSHGTAVLFVTHEINPVLPYADWVLYLADGRFRSGTVDDVMTSASLSALFGTPVEVLRSGGRLVVAGIPDAPGHDHAHRPVEVLP